MFISKHNLKVFLRIPKNGSTSVAAWFVKNMGKEDDIWTRVNDAGIKDHNVPPEYIQKHRNQYHFIHTTLQEIVDGGLIESPSFYDNIGIIRNPLDRQLSLFFFLNRNGTVDQFREQFKNGCHVNDVSNKIKQVDYTVVNGVQWGTFWCYDRIPEHLESLRLNYGFKEVYKLPSYKSDRKPKNNDLIDTYYDKYTKDAVLDYYKEDWETYQELKCSN